MTNIKLMAYVFACVLAAFLTSCEKQVGEDEQEKTTETDGVTLLFEAPTAVPYTTIGEVGTASAVENTTLTQLSVCVFKDGKRVKSVHQSADDNLFMKPSMRLENGTYSIVAVAHAGAGHATVTKGQRITFYKNKVTDTYVYRGVINVSEKSTLTLPMKRVTAMFELCLTSVLPPNVAQVEFLYTGGSSTLDAASLEGCVKSREKETREVSDAMRSVPPTFAIYTFPRPDSDGLKINVHFNDKNGNTLHEETYEDVLVKVGMNTRHACSLPSDFVDALSKWGHFEP